MKTYIFTFLIMILPILGFGQIKSSVDLMYGIDYTYRNLKTTSEDSTVLGIFEKRQAVEKGKLNWRFGFNYNQRLTNKVYIKTGLRLASIGYKGEKQTDLRWPSENVGGEYVFDPNLPHEVQLIYNYWFVEIPLALRFEYLDKKFTPFVEIGVSPSIFMTTKTISKTDIDTSSSFSKGNNQNFNKFQMVGVVSMGMSYQISDKFQVFGQPSFRYHLTKLVDAPIEEKLYNYGLEIGIRMKII